MFQPPPSRSFPRTLLSCVTGLGLLGLPGCDDSSGKELASYTDAVTSEGNSKSATSLVGASSLVSDLSVLEKSIAGAQLYWEVELDIVSNRPTAERLAKAMIIASRTDNRLLAAVNHLMHSNILTSETGWILDFTKSSLLVSHLPEYDGRLDALGSGRVLVSDSVITGSADSCYIRRSVSYVPNSFYGSVAEGHYSKVSHDIVRLNDDGSEVSLILRYPPQLLNILRPSDGGITQLVVNLPAAILSHPSTVSNIRISSKIEIFRESDTIVRNFEGYFKVHPTKSGKQSIIDPLYILPSQAELDAEALRRLLSQAEAMDRSFAEIASFRSKLPTLAASTESAQSTPAYVGLLGKPVRSLNLPLLDGSGIVDILKQADSLPIVLVYTAPSCPPCRLLKEGLKSLFTELNRSGHEPQFLLVFAYPDDLSELAAARDPNHIEKFRPFGSSHLGVILNDQHASELGLSYSQGIPTIAVIDGVSNYAAAGTGYLSYPDHPKSLSGFIRHFYVAGERPDTPITQTLAELFFRLKNLNRKQEISTVRLGE